jgi:glyoxylase-like metal-dependent hydrolase (beta-lactamase superfamily II)
MMIPLEDTAADIVGKAQRGLAISESQLAERAGISPDCVRELRDGKFDDASLSAVAPVLGLDAASLVRLSRNEWKAEEIPPIEGLAQFNTAYGEMTVNAYLVWDPPSREAAAIDTGADCSEMLKRGALDDLSFMMILLTHAHPDHIEDLVKLRGGTGAPVYTPEYEPVSDAQIIGDGHRFKLGPLEIEARLTSGHSRGGMTYVVTGLARPIAVVGDSLFAASMGGGAVSYADALRNNLEKILTLPDETIVCPGHGPLTTVGKEKRENPFFAAHFRK